MISRESPRGFSLSECVWTLAAGLFTSLICGVLIYGMPGEFWRDDFQSGSMPVYVDMNRAIHEGSFPLISPYSWVGGRIGGEYQSGLFSIFHWAVLIFVFKLGLSLGETAAAIVLCYMVVYGAGAFRLGRAMGVGRQNSLIVSLAAAINGWVFFWASQTWVSFLASLAWLPWVWWGLLIAQDRRLGRWRFFPAGIFIYLLFTAATPHADIVAATVTVWLVLRTVAANRRVRRTFRFVMRGKYALAFRMYFSGNLMSKLWPICAAWMLGLALASPAILMLMETFPESARSSEGLPEMERWKWTLPAAALPGVILPTTITEWKSWDNVPVVRDSFELYGGFVPVVAFLAAFFRLRWQFVRRYFMECVLLGIALFLCFFGAYGSFRWPFRWLPLFHLILGLLGALAVQAWPKIKTDSRRPLWKSAFASLGGWGLVFVVVALGMTLLESSAIAERIGKPTHIWAGAIMMCCLCVAWVFCDLTGSRWPKLQAWTPAVVATAAIVGPWQLFLSDESVTKWHFDQRIMEAGKLDKDRLYFAIMSYKDAYSPDPDNGLLRRFGNTSMCAGVKFVNGYGTMQPYIMQALLPMEWSGFMRRKVAKVFVKKEAKPDGLLQSLGVDGLVLGHDYADLLGFLEKHGWKVVSRNPREILLHKDGPKNPLAWPIEKVQWVGDRKEIVLGVLKRGNAPMPTMAMADERHAAGSTSDFGQIDVSNIEESRLGVKCRVSNPSDKREGFVAFSRAWYSGYRATLDGEPLKAYALNGIQPGVCIPPGAKGELVLRYDPPSIHFGFKIGLAGLFAAIVCPWFLRKR